MFKHTHALAVTFGPEEWEHECKNINGMTENNEERKAFKDAVYPKTKKNPIFIFSWIQIGYVPILRK